MKKLALVLFMMIAIADSQEVFALSAFDAGAVNTIDVMDLRLHDIMKRESKQVQIKRENKAKSEAEQQKVDQASLSDIKFVSFLHNTSIPSQELFKVIQSYVNQPMNIQNVSQIRKEVMNYYQNKGFYSALVTVSSENTQTGELVLDIQEGNRNSVTVIP